MISRTDMCVRALQAFMNHGWKSEDPFTDGVKIGQAVILELKSLLDDEAMLHLLPDSKNVEEQYEKFIRGLLFAFENEDFG